MYSPIIYLILIILYILTQMGRWQQNKNVITIALVLDGLVLLSSSINRKVN